jgi:peptide-methionine (S)-S-oxide reductase
MRIMAPIVALAACAFALTLLAAFSAKESNMKTTEETPPADDHLQKATFGSGCFWCTEAVFLQMKGVQSVQSGYSGGHVPNPDYRLICTGTTGHAEVIQVTFNPKVVTYPELLEVFWKSHDPTTLNRQGNDVGTQYRSVVFYHNEEQRRQAEAYKQKLDAAGAFDRPIVTEISPLTDFCPAEDYHQDYFALHGHEPYCQMVIRPKVDKVREVFREKLKTEVDR